MIHGSAVQTYLKKTFLMSVPEYVLTGTGNRIEEAMPPRIQSSSSTVTVLIPTSSVGSSEERLTSVL